MKNLDNDTEIDEIMNNSQISILIVEDDKGLNRLIQKKLRKEHFRTDSVLSGNDCIIKISNNKKTILLLDYILPDMTGQQVVETLTRMNYEVPFIIMTSFGDEKLAVEMKKLGARDYIVKDSDFIETLPQVIKRTLTELNRENKLKVTEHPL